MNIREVHYARKFNLGNYESEEIGLLVELDAAEDLDEAFKALKGQVFRLHDEGGRLEKAKARVEIEEVEAVFPEDLRGLVTFDVGEEYVTIRPREYLGSDNSGKIAAIVRNQLQGEYFSVGKDSQFRIRRVPCDAAQPQEAAKTSLTAKIASYRWSRFEKAKGEWIFTDKAPELKEALEKADGKLDLEYYTYKFSG